MSLEIARYAAAVGAALADLPEQLRNELLEDLPAHLSEVAAEIEAEGDAARGVTLADRLGPPDAYAAELRATLGHPGSNSRAAARMNALFARSRARWRAVDRRVGPLIGYESFSAFAGLLRPAWWVLRGWLAAMLLAQIWRDSSGLGLLPRFEGSDVLGVLILVGFVIGSIWLGRRAAPAKLMPRLALGGATAVLVVFGLAAWITADGRLQGEHWYEPSSTSYDPYSNIGDVYVISPDGQILNGVRLVDQSGNPVLIGWCSGGNDGSPGWEWRVTYPRCLDAQPPRLPWSKVTPGPIPWATPSATPSLPTELTASAKPTPTAPTPTPTAPASGPTPTPTVRG